MLSKLLDQLGSENPVVRNGAVRLLQNRVLELPRTRAGAGQRSTFERTRSTPCAPRGKCDAITMQAADDVIELLRGP